MEFKISARARLPWLTFSSKSDKQQFLSFFRRRTFSDFHHVLHIAAQVAAFRRTWFRNIQGDFLLRISNHMINSYKKNSHIQINKKHLKYQLPQKNNVRAKQAAMQPVFYRTFFLENEKLRSCNTCGKCWAWIKR